MKKPLYIVIAIVTACIIAAVLLQPAISFSKEKKAISSSSVGETVKYGNYEWIVVQKNDNQVQLVTRNIVSDHLYYDYSDGLTYADSEARRWLNSDFYNDSFTSAEKELIAETSLEEGCNDKVFLLAPDEAQLFFPSYADRILTYEDGTKGWWWLRSDTNEKGTAYYFNATGDLTSPSHSVHTEFGGMRPSIWINLE